MSTTIKRAMLTGILITAAITLLAVRPLVFSQEEAKPTMSKDVVWPAADIKFNELIPGVQQAVLWGDPTKGAYGALTRFKAGQNNPLHTHTSDLKIVVISGTLIHGTESGEKTLGPGSYLFVPGGMKHTSGCGAEADCLFLQESPDKFDLNMVESTAETK